MNNINWTNVIIVAVVAILCFALLFTILFFTVKEANASSDYEIEYLGALSPGFGLNVGYSFRVGRCIAVISGNASEAAIDCP
jgi:hypothetical protein